MSALTLTHVRKLFGTSLILEDINLEIADGELIVFVGPSGCGKSTLLRLIAGLDDVSGGEISIGGKVVNDVAPARRGVAMVFQSYALYPHMTVYENMSFGLRLAKLQPQEIDAAVRSAARKLHIDHLLDKRPKVLSGGQRQRVAIGRAIVRKPNVFLFDEPLSNLDAALRASMRYELAKLHRRAEDDDDLRDARSDRGDDARKAHRRAVGGTYRAGRHADASSTRIPTTSSLPGSSARRA